MPEDAQHGQSDDDRPEERDDFAHLVQERCLLANDVITIAKAEPKHWRRHGATLEYSMAKADWSQPFVVVRTRVEKVKGRKLVFALLAMPHEDEDDHSVLFGEFACTRKRFKRTVKRFGFERPFPRRADGFAMVPSPAELDEMLLACLLAGDDGAVDEASDVDIDLGDHDDDVPF